MRNVLGLCLVLAVSMSLAGCITGANVNRSIATSATLTNVSQPAGSAFAVLPSCSIVGPSADPRFASIAQGIIEEDRQLMGKGSAQRAAFVESLVSDYLVMKGYRKAGADDKPAFYVTTQCIDGFIASEGGARVVTAARYVQPAATAQSLAPTGIWTDMTAIPADTSTDRALVLVISFWVPLDAGGYGLAWQGRAITSDIDEVESDCVDLAWAALERLQPRGTIIRGSLQSDLAFQGYNVIIEDPFNAGCAAKAGLDEEDVLISIDGATFTSTAAVEAFCATRKAGTYVNVIITRGGRRVVKPLVLGARILTDVTDL